MDLEAHLAKLLADAESQGLLRVPLTFTGAGAHATLRGRPLVSFASNDYLGLATDARLRAVLAEGAAAHAGAGSSRLVAGTTPAHADAEAALATLVALPAARLFASAYAANQGILGVFGRNDVVLSDSLNHASIVDGCRLSRARVEVFRHSDLDHLERLLSANRSPRGVMAVVTETIFSMDGDVADVRALRALTHAYGAALVVDEAHALGVVGPAGRGVCAALQVCPDVLVGGLGKAFGLAGGFVAGSRALMGALDNFARPLIYSTAVLPAIAHAVPTAINLVTNADGARRAVQRHANALRTAAQNAGYSVMGRAPAAIVPVRLGDPQRATSIAAGFRERGFLVPVMRPPTVPAGTSRLRWTPSALHTDAEIAAVSSALSDLLGDAASPR